MIANCIFCKIIAKLIPSQIIDQNERLLVIKDICPKATIHYLIIPKQHINDLLDLKDFQTAADILFMAQKLAQSLDSTKDFRLITNNGPAAGQSVFHLHFHFLAGKNIPTF